MTEQPDARRDSHARRNRDPASTTLSELRYAGGTMLVDEDICTAVFDYAIALSKAGQSAVVSVPSIVAGLEVHSNILLGSATQLWCAPAAGVFPDISDDDKVREIRAGIVGLTPRVAFAASPVADDGFEYGL